MENNNKGENTADQYKEAQAALLEALRNQPSKYDVEVIDNSSLPDQLKKKKHISFTIKPPTFHVLSKIGLVVEELPEHLFADTAMSKEALQHLDKILLIISIMVHGSSKKEMPDWYVPFLKDNLTVQESLQLWFEAAQKLQTGFFLPFFQTVRQMNPLTAK